MKTLFTMGFAQRRSFWMGQQFSSTALDNAISSYNDIQAWVANTGDVKGWLGSDYDRFQSSLSQAAAAFNSAVGISEKLQAGMTLSDDEVTTANSFVGGTDIASSILQMHPIAASATTPAATAPAGGTTTPATTPAATSTSTPTGTQSAQQTAGQAIQAIKNAISPPKPAQKIAPPLPVAPAPSNQTALIAVGVGVVALLAIVALA